MSAKVRKEDRAEREHLYGCCVDLDDDEAPDGCVLDYGEPADCIFARGRRTKWTCPYWVLTPKFLATRAALSALEEQRHGN
jgi:hypothetical protein